MEDKTLDIQDLFYVLKRRYKVIVICMLLCLVAGGAMTYKMKPSYTAKVKIFASRNEQMQANSSDELKSNASLMATATQFIKTEDFMNKVVDKAKLNVNPTSLVGGLVFNIAQDAPIMDISYTAQDADTAKKVIKTMSSEFEVGVKEVIPNIHTKVIDSVKVMPRMPNKKKVIIVALMAGIILGVGVVLVLDYLDDRVRKKEDIEKLLEIPVIGVIPEYVANEARRKKSLRNRIKSIFKRSTNKIEIDLKEENKCLK